MRTARDYHQPPSRWYGGDGSWTERDLLATTALTMYEAGLHVCGQPRRLSFSEDADGFYEPLTATCQACAALERHSKHLQETKTVSPGLVLMLRNTQRPGERIAPWLP